MFPTSRRQQQFFRPYITKMARSSQAMISNQARSVVDGHIAVLLDKISGSAVEMLRITRAKTLKESLARAVIQKVCAGMRLSTCPELFPPPRVRAFIKEKYRGLRIAHDALLVITGAVESLVKHLIKEAAYQCKDDGRKIIKSRHIFLAIVEHPEYVPLFKNSVIAGSGVNPLATYDEEDEEDEA